MFVAGQQIRSLPAGLSDTAVSSDGRIHGGVYDRRGPCLRGMGQVAGRSGSLVVRRKAQTSLEAADRPVHSGLLLVQIVCQGWAPHQAVAAQLLVA